MGDEANNPLDVFTALAAALIEGGSKTNKNVSSAAASLLVNVAVVCSPAEAMSAGELVTPSYYAKTTNTSERKPPIRCDRRALTHQ